MSPVSAMSFVITASSGANPPLEPVASFVPACSTLISVRPSAVSRPRMMSPVVGVPG